MKRFVIVGFVIWAGATIALRVAGQYVFRSTGTAAAVLLLLISLPLMVAVAVAVLQNAEQRALAAIALVAPYSRRRFNLAFRRRAPAPRLDQNPRQDSRRAVDHRAT